MSLHLKLILSYLGVASLLFATNLFAVSQSLKKQELRRVETAEVFFAKEITSQIYRLVIEEKGAQLTDLLFEMLKFREEKIDYILVFDRKGYLVAHTYLKTMPKTLLKLSHIFSPKQEYRIQRIKTENLDVYDIAIPVKEGITQVGTLHMGTNYAYLYRNQYQTFLVLLNITSLVAIIVVLGALWFSKLILRPIQKLKEAASEIGQGRLDYKIDVFSKDEIGHLADAFRKITDNLKNLMAEKYKMAADMAAADVARKNAEEASKAYKDLAELKAMLMQSEKLAALGKLGTGVAHELNSPLISLLGLIETMMNEKPQDCREYENLKSIQKACEHMTKIINDLETFSNDSKAEKDNIDCNNLIESTLSFSDYPLRSRQIVIEKNYTENLPFVKGSKNQLQQVIVNMITNAQDAMPENGVFKITTKRVKKEEGDFVVMEFSDNGSGIAPEHIKNIFDPFFTTKMPGKGIGLGLSVSYKIIKDHNGIISVNSKLGIGTTFSVYLPI